MISIYRASNVDYHTIEARRDIPWNVDQDVITIIKWLYKLPYNTREAFCEKTGIDIENFDVIAEVFMKPEDYNEQHPKISNGIEEVVVTPSSGRRVLK